MADCKIKNETVNGIPTDYKVVLVICLINSHYYRDE